MRKKTDLAMAVDLAWAAGFFEGEGCIYATRQVVRGRTSPDYNVLVSLANTDPKALAVLQSLFGGGVYEEKKTGQIAETFRNRVFRWQIASHNTYRFLKAIYPYLHTDKKKQVDVALKLLKTFSFVRRGKASVTPDDVAYRYQLWQELKKLKKARKPSPQLRLNIGGRIEINR